MAQKEKGKNIFQSAVDAVSNRDEKAAIQAAMKRGEELEQQVEQVEQKLAAAEQRATQTGQKLTEAEKKIAELSAELKTAQAELASARSALSTSKIAISVAEQKLALTNTELQKYVSADQAKKIAEAAAAADRAQTIAEHTLKADESLSHLALKYYGSAYEPYWRVIYEANKELIGDNPGRVRPGMVIKIPVLPEELKKK